MRKVLNINIPKPCHEDWNKMTPEEKGRHCNMCKKTVFDFTTKTDEYIVKTFESNANICGRFKTTQLKRDLVFSRKETNNYLSFVASGLFAFIGLSSYYSVAQANTIKTNIFQQGKPQYIEDETKTDQSSNLIKGIVIDNDKIPLPGATVVIKKTTVGTQTDFDGLFSIKANKGDILQISYIGYKTKELKITDNTPNLIKLTMDEDIMGELISVVVGGAIGKSSYTCSPEELEKRRLNKLRKTNYFNFYKRKRKEHRVKIKNGTIKRTKVGHFLYSLFHKKETIIK